MKPEVDGEKAGAKTAGRRRKQAAKPSAKAQKQSGQAAEEAQLLITDGKAEESHGSDRRTAVRRTSVRKLNIDEELRKRGGMQDGRVS